MKTYAQMTPAERLADRIAKNRAMENRIALGPIAKVMDAKLAAGTRMVPLVCGIRRLQSR